GELHRDEQALFGGVHDDKSNGMEPLRSLVDVVVSGDVKREPKGSHISVGSKINREANNKNVSLSAYLGMGPIHFSGKCEKSPISQGERFSLSVTWPSGRHQEMVDTLSLFSHFGCLGSRSRNGWGSIHVAPSSPVKPSSYATPSSPVKGDGQGKESSRTTLDNLKGLPYLYGKYGEDIQKILRQDKAYPFRLGMGIREGKKRPLIWRIAASSDWKGAMQAAAEKYMDIRQTLPFPKEKSGKVERRHLVGYPVTNHVVPQWGGFNGRMPSQLRIILRRENGKYVSYFFHLPHSIAKPWDETRLGTELSIWQGLHNWLDANCTAILL
ncbi:MAG: hypothetical protein HQK66_06950, partial [Desulfamplus sp.]|nr:hypothetical protein [Desulfamplus sp.]